MPITPKFQITQDDDHLYIKVIIPHVRINSLEIIAEGCDFSFYCKPYLLKLSFPYDLNGEDDKCKGVYDPDTEDGLVNVTIPKRIKGQYFPNLDLLTTLLFKAPISSHVTSELSIKNNSIPKIQIVSESETNDIDDDDSDDVNDDDKLCEQLSAAYDQDNDDDNIHLNSTTYSYGFLNQYHNMLTHLQELLSDVIELPSPDTTSFDTRHQLRLVSEIQLFDASRYLGDYFQGTDDILYIEAKQYQPFYCLDYAQGVALNKQKEKEKDKLKEAKEQPTADAVTTSSGKGGRGGELVTVTADKAHELSNHESASHGITNASTTAGTATSAGINAATTATNVTTDTATITTTTTTNTTTTTTTSAIIASSDFFTAEEKDMLVNQLKCNSFNTISTTRMPSSLSSSLLSSSSRSSSSSLSESTTQDELLLNLTDIIFSVCYEYRLVCGEYNVEACANITRLSAVLSWFDHHRCSSCNSSSGSSSSNMNSRTMNNNSNASNNNNIDKKVDPGNGGILSVLYSCCRRSYIYPYLRHRKYFLKVLTDMAKIFILGKKYILKLLLGLKKKYDKTHTYYILNKLYINDYCVWIQHVSDDVIMSFAIELNKQITQFIQYQMSYETNYSKSIAATTTADGGDGDSRLDQVTDKVDISLDNWLDLHIRKLEVWATRSQQQQQQHVVNDNDDDSDSDDDDENDHITDDDDDDNDDDDIASTSMPMEFTCEGRLNDFHSFLSLQLLQMDHGEEGNHHADADDSRGNSKIVSGGGGDDIKVLSLNRLITEINLKKE